MRFVSHNTKTMWKKTADSRIEMPQYVKRSIFECLVYALIHRDYTIIGSEVHIDIFDDKMTIYSPGGMPDGRIIQDINIKNIPSTRRNPVLSDIFQRIGFMERQGSGLEKIIEAYESSIHYTLDKQPIFYSDRAQFSVTLMNLNYIIENENAYNHVKSEINQINESCLYAEINGQMSELNNSLTENNNILTELSIFMSEKKDDKTYIRVKKVIDYLSNNQSIKSNDVAALLDVSQRTSRRILNDMIEKNLLLSEGSTKSRIYFLKK